MNKPSFPTNAGGAGRAGHRLLRPAGRLRRPRGPGPLRRPGLAAAPHRAVSQGGIVD